MAEKYGALLERGAGMAPGPVAKFVIMLCGGGGDCRGRDCGGLVGVGDGWSWLCDGWYDWCR